MSIKSKTNVILDIVIKEIQEEILEDFNMFDDWMKYEYLIDLGKDLPSIDEKYRVEENLIKVSK